MAYHCHMQNIWSQIQSQLSNTLTPGNYKVWIAPLQASVSGSAASGDLCLQLYAPTEFVALRVKERFLADIRQAACRVAGAELVVSIVCGKPEKPLPGFIPEAASQATAVKSVTVNQPSQLGLPLNFSVKPIACPDKYSFDSFVVGPSNELAYAAAKSICCEDMPDVNTLFLVSGPGLGKTHLMQAMLSNLRHERLSRCKVACLTAEEFGSRMVAAIKARDTERFKAIYRDVDVLLLEDIQFLQGKEKMQDEVLSTIKSIRDHGGRVVFSSSFLPQDLHDLDSQLASRFCSGFFAQIAPPCFETRKSIFKQKAKIHQIMLPDSVAELLAEHIQNDVRRIESCLHNLILQARMLNRDISLDLAASLLEQYSDRDEVLDFNSIVQTVCRAFGLKKEDIASKTRRSVYVSARNAIFFLARKHTDMTLAEIGRAFNRTHTTVIKGISSLEREINKGSPQGAQMQKTIELIERNSRLRV